MVVVVVFVVVVVVVGHIAPGPRVQAVIKRNLACRFVLPNWPQRSPDVNLVETC